MYSTQANLLLAVIDKINGWQGEADTANMQIDQINMTFPDNSRVSFAWDAGITPPAWKIDTTATAPIGT